MTDLRQAAQQVLEPSDFQKWSVLAFRALDDAGRVLMTIEPESTTEGERLDQLKETIRELLTQVLLLNGVWTRRQLDERFQFGKLDTDALNVQLGQQQAALKQQAEPVAWQYKTVEAGVFVSDQHPPDVEVWNDIEWSKPLYTTPPQRKPLTMDEIGQAWAVADGEHNASASVKRRITRAIEAKLKERNDG